MGIKNWRRIAAILLCCTILQAGPATADRPVEPSPVQRVSRTLNPANWRMPSFLKMPDFRGMLPAKEDQTRIRKKKNSLVDDVSKTASQSWQRTKQTLSPKNLNPIRFMPASTKSARPAKPADSPGFFGSMFSSPREPSRPTTVTDFLGQEKPKG
jgi:hypothetical protein